MNNQANKTGDLSWKPTSNIYTCHGCGFKTVSEPSGSFDICPICMWEDDRVQNADPQSSGGANQQNLYVHQGIVTSILEATGQSDATKLNGIEKDLDWYPMAPGVIQALKGRLDDYTRYWTKISKADVLRGEK